MKKILIIITFFVFIMNISSTEIDLSKNAKTSILMEQSTGKILFEKNKDEKRSPASMTKMMTLLLTFEALDKEMITYDTMVNISKNAQDMGGTQIFLEYGSSIDVLTLIKGITIASANDAAVAIAEKLGGTEENFVQMMNDKAKELGCKNTNFKNPHGLDEKEHYTTAYDLALIARELLKYEDVIKFTSTYEDYINVSGENHWLVNTNKLVRFYEGIDGLKTGYTENAKYCLTATMKKNDMRLISIVMGEDTKENRNADTISMMEYGFSQYGVSNIYNKEDVIGKTIIENAKNKEVKYYFEEDVNLIVKKGDREIGYKIDTKIYDVEAPLKEKSVIGEAIISYNNQEFKYNLIIHEKIEKESFLNVIYSVIKNIISGSET